MQSAVKLASFKVLKEGINLSHLITRINLSHLREGANAEQLLSEVALDLWQPLNDQLVSENDKEQAFWPRG